MHVIFICVYGDAFAHFAECVGIFARYAYARIYTFAFFAYFIFAFTFDSFTRGITSADFVASELALIYTFTFSSIFITSRSCDTVCRTSAFGSGLVTAGFACEWT